MWKLVSLSLAYHLKALIVAWVIALLLSKLGLVILAIVAIVLASAEDKERRLLLHLPLPVTRTQVGWARVVFPAMILVLGTAAAGLLSLATVAALRFFTSLLDLARTVQEGALDQLFFATMVIFFSQFLLTLGELNVWGRGDGPLRLLMAFATLVAMLGITLVAWVVMATSGSYLVVACGTVGLTLVLMGVTVFLFERRPSFAG